MVCHVSCVLVSVGTLKRKRRFVGWSYRMLWKAMLEEHRWPAACIAEGNRDIFESDLLVIPIVEGDQVGKYDG